MHLIKQLLTFDIGWHHDLSTLEILHSPWLMASVNIKSPGLTKNHVNWYQESITVYYGCFLWNSSLLISCVCFWRNLIELWRGSYFHFDVVGSLMKCQHIIMYTIRPICFFWIVIKAKHLQTLQLFWRFIIDRYL